MKKKNSGLADSPFFKPTSDGGEVVFAQDKPEIPIPPVEDGVMPPRYHATTIEAIRHAVKIFGKEAATHRFTTSEKRAIATIVHDLNMQGTRTSENEITRIAINFVIDDFRQHGRDSVLGQVLQALHR